MRRTGSWAIFGVGVLAACSSLDSQSLNGSSDSGFQPGAAGSTPAAGSTGAGNPLVVAEQEEDMSFRAPVVSGRWVWTANPDTGKVAVVDAKSFSVRLADAGSGPTFLTALPSDANSSRALVINVGSHDATLLSANAAGPVMAVGPISLQRDANAWTVGKTGQFAIAWLDSHALTLDPAEGYQDFTVLDLRGKVPVPTRLSAGFLPSRVFIDSAEQHAFVVAKSGITVIDLAAAAGPRVVRELPVSHDLQEDYKTRDVSVMPDGSFAFVRHEGSPVLTLVDLATGDLSPITLSGPVTDLDLVANAKSALAVVRGYAPPSQPFNEEAGASNGEGRASNGEAGASNGEAGASNGEGGAGSSPDQPANTGAGSGGAAANQISTLAILPIPGIFSAPAQFDAVSIDELFGLVNIAPQGTSALLYTNALPNSHLTVLETAHGKGYLTYRTVDVRGYVHEVFPSPDGAYAIASLSPLTAGGKPGFAAIPVDKALPVRVQTTDAPVFAVAQSAGPGARAVVTVSDGKSNFSAYIVRMPELVIDPVKLPSRPLPNATGLVPDAGVAYIAQAHPQGRITFINLETGVPRTITGFEISAKVVDGR